MMDDPCDDVGAYAHYIRWARLSGRDISKLSWIWIEAVFPDSRGRGISR